MKYDVYKCDWCKEEIRTPKGKTPPNGVWAEREGTIPTQKESAAEDRKWVEPVKQTVIFCKAPCNAAQKEAEAKALVAANSAWLNVYNRLAP